MIFRLFKYFDVIVPILKVCGLRLIKSLKILQTDDRNNRRNQPVQISVNCNFWVMSLRQMLTNRFRVNMWEIATF